MKLLVVGRTYPTNKTGSVGMFEYEQAFALSEEIQTTYLFIDNQSIKKHKKTNYFFTKDGNLDVTGKYLPIGGLPHNIYDKIKAFYFKKLFNEVYRDNNYPDIVHFHFPLLTSNENIISFLLEKGIKIVVTEHWSKVLSKELTQIEHDRLEYINENAKIISVSEKLTESISQLLKISSNEIKTIPNYVNDNVFFIESKDSKNTNEIISIGRLISTKNNKLLLCVTNRFGIDDVFIKIVGSGPDKENLLSYVVENKLHNIEFISFMSKEELRIALNHAQLYVTTSLKETFGVPVVEAWFCGTPVVIPKCHPLAKYITTENGLTYDINDPLDLSNQLKKAMNMKWNDRIIREKALSIFSKDNVIRKIKTVYEEEVK